MTAPTEAPDPTDEDYEVPESPEAKAAWRILNDRMAAWAMRRLRTLKLRRRTLIADADEEIDRWKRHKAQQTRAIDVHINYFEGVLGRYVLERRADRDDGRKTVSTPYGDITSRTTQASWVITDMDAAVAWAKKYHPELVRNVETFALGEAKTVLGTVGSAAVDEESGVLVSGVQVTPGGISPSVNVDLRPGGS